MIPVFTHLQKQGVPFVVIGGHAVNFHGFIRATEDFDILFLRTDESEKRLLDALLQINACWIGNQINPETGIEKEFPVSADFIRSNHLMMLVTSMGYLDIFDFVPGFPQTPVEELMNTACTLDDVRIVNLEWLKKIKSASGRPRDQYDLENLP